MLGLEEVKINKKILLGAILIIGTFFISTAMFLLDSPYPPFFSMIQFIVVFASGLIILNGIAESKKIFKTYRYDGELSILVSVVEKSISQMNLIVKNKSITDNSFYFSLSEKMRWLSTYWPVHLDIKAEKSGTIIDLNIHAWYTLYSIIQTKHTQKKAQEFLDLVKYYLPKRKEFSKWDAITMRYVKGEITKEEYEKIIKEIES